MAYPIPKHYQSLDPAYLQSETQGLWERIQKTQESLAKPTSSKASCHLTLAQDWSDLAHMRLVAQRPPEEIRECWRESLSHSGRVETLAFRRSL